MGKDYYKLLGVGKECSDDDLKKAYKKQGKYLLGLVLVTSYDYYD